MFRGQADLFVVLCGVCLLGRLGGGGGGGCGDVINHTRSILWRVQVLEAAQFQSGNRAVHTLFSQSAGVWVSFQLVTKVILIVIFCHMNHFCKFIDGRENPYHCLAPGYLRLTIAQSPKLCGQQ